MKIGAAIEKMIQFYGGSIHDINHFLKVYAYAKTIGEQEGLDPLDQQVLELAAVVHDIACPLCRVKYGSTNGKLQEREGEPMARAFLEELVCEEKVIGRVCYLVAHHHTFHDVDGPDYQILLEADYLVNADESCSSARSIENALEQIFKTATGKELLKSIYTSPRPDIKHEKILGTLRGMEKRPGMYVPGYPNYDRLDFYLEGYFCGLGSDLLRKAGCSFGRKHGMGSTVSLGSMIKIKHEDLSEEERCSMYLSVLIEFLESEKGRQAT